MKTIRHIFIFILFSTVLLIATNAHATLPIAGQTMEFDTTGTTVGSTTAFVQGVAQGDLDNDGYIDLISAEDPNVVVWKNDATPFGAGWATSQIAGSNASGGFLVVAVGDLDNDGDMDIISGGNDFNVTVWENDGSPFTGAWTGQVVGAQVGQIFHLAVADLDNDGDLDIASGDGPGSVVVWQNNGTPFGAGWSSQSVATNVGTNSVFSISAGDLDKDGDTDLVVSATYGIRAWENDGTPFTDVWSGPSFGNVSQRTWSAIGDLDGDGYLDIASGGEDAAIRVWQNDGTPFDAAWTTSQTIYSAGNKLAAIDLGDMDNDGDLDVLAGARDDFNVYAFQNDGTPFDAGSWANIVVGSHTNRAISLAVADLDNDGDLDVGSGGRDSTLRIWENDAVHRNAPFANSGNTIGGGWTLDVALGDVDGDGDLDAFVAQYTHAGTANHVFENDGSGVFSLTNSLGSGRSRGVDLGDVDGDGDLDAFVANWGVNKVWKNNGDGIFSDSGNNLGTANTEAVALGDVDGDGDLDAFAANHSGASVVWKNDGNGNFTAFATLGSSDSYNVALGDLDRDGDLDAFVANRSQPNVVWQNDGSGNFTAIANLGSAESFGVALGDINGDGDLDAFVANSVDNALWINNGSGGFTASSQTFSGTSGNEVALIDLDGDGDLDTFFSSSKSDKVWLNDGAGNFSNSGQNLVTWASTGIAIGDLDGDGDPDAAFSAKNASNQIWRNEGGSAGFALADTSVSSPVYIPDSTEDDVMKVVFTHNGLAGDRSLELARFDLDFFRGDCSTPLSNAEADAFLDEIHIRLDDGNNSFDTSDTLVASISSFSMTSGVQSIAFTNDDANAQVAGTTSKTYWISVLATATASTANPNNFCLNFDPDADALVEGKTPDFSVSIQDSVATNTGDVPTAVSLHSITPTNNSIIPIALAILLLALMSGVVFHRRFG